jgi:hypothetical protein
MMLWKPRCAKFFLPDIWRKHIAPQLNLRDTPVNRHPWGGMAWHLHSFSYSRQRYPRAMQVLEYGVNGIPHFVFLDGQGRVQAAAVGKLPPEVLNGDLRALAEGTSLPYARVRGAVSPMQRPDAVMAGPSRSAGPLDHS